MSGGQAASFWLGRAAHKLDQPGERQAALGVLEGLPGPGSYQVAENPRSPGRGRDPGTRRCQAPGNSPACGSGQAVAGACPRHELVGVDAARDVLVGVGESLVVDVQAFHLIGARTTYASRPGAEPQAAAVQ
jgi:hypothetical protein